MARTSPNRKHLDDLGAIFMPYAPGDAEPIDVAQAVSGLPREEDALTDACVLIDWPTRGTLEITGGDRLGFLNNMLTQELKGFEPGTVRESFWLSRKGRVEADLRLLELGDRTLAGVDAHRAAHTAETLGAFLFAEDVTITDRTDDLHRVSLHGPRALSVLESLAGITLSPARVAEGSIAGVPVIAAFDETAGVPGVGVRSRTEDAPAVFGTLAGAVADAGGCVAGWHAWNIARIEAGTPVYYLDFGPDSIPQESGCFQSRVSLTKGCYLGQEVVARLHARGKPKQVLAGIDLVSTDPTEQPMTGDLLYAAENDTAPVGAVTSATRSPRRGDAPIAMAQIRTKHAAAGTELRVHTGAGIMTARVRESLDARPPANRPVTG